MSNTMNGLDLLNQNSVLSESIYLDRVNLSHIIGQSNFNYLYHYVLLILVN